jgi:glycosyltransferase involved in cell wall biosynthesis
MDKQPLLSIFIPTKNGISTITSAIESCLSNKRPDLEVIVHDCSDDDQIKRFVDKNWKHESRLKYYYSEKNLSMTDNFNEALSKCSGRYVCGIGDDDAVLQNILSIVDWMDMNKVECVKQPMTNYFWPSPKSLSPFNGKLRLNKNLNNKVIKLDLEKNFSNVLVNCGFGYIERLPAVYHAIVKLGPWKEHFEKTGHFFGGSSFDVYSACVLPTYLKNTYLISFPFTIFGAGSNSNTMRNVNSESLDIHYDDFSDVSDFDYLPNLRNCEISTAESFVEALIDIGKPHLIDKMNLAVVYGKCAADRPQLFLSLFKRFMSLIDKKTSIFSFLAYFLFYFVRRLFFKIKVSIIGVGYRSFPVFFDFMSKKYSKSKIIPATDIKAAKSIIEKEINLSGLNLTNVCQET